MGGARMLLLMLLLSTSFVTLFAVQELEHEEPEEPLPAEDEARLKGLDAPLPNDDVTSPGKSTGQADDNKTCTREDDVCIKKSLATLRQEEQVCAERLAGHMKQLTEFQEDISKGITEGQARQSIFDAQILNLRAQNQKLVQELTRYQSLGSENDNLQRSMRKMSTDHDAVSRQIEKVSGEVADLEEKLKTLKRETNQRNEKCEDSLSILKDAYWTHQLRVDDALK